MKSCPSLINLRNALLLTLCLICTAPAARSQAPKIAPCSAPEYHQFDFWIGDWDGFEASSPSPDARNRVDRILDGCVLREDYQETNGHKGQSFTIYDATRKVWHQTWVTNRGALLTIEGTLQGDAIVLSGGGQAVSTYPR